MRFLSSRRSADRSGTSTVEFALVAPVFFMVIFSMFEFSRLNVIRHTADNAAYEAARVAIVPGANAAEAIAEANRILNMIGTQGAVVTVSPSTLVLSTTDVTVEIDIPLSQNGWVVPKFTASQSLHAEATLRTERVQTR